MKWVSELPGTDFNGSHDSIGQSASSLVSHDAEGRVLVRAALDQGTVATADDIGALFSIDPATGATVWRAVGIDQKCAPSVDANGDIWVIADTPDPNQQRLAALDPDTGMEIANTSFTRTTSTSTNPRFSVCDNVFRPGMRFLDNGTTLITFESVAGSPGGGEWLRAIDTSSRPPTQLWVAQPPAAGSHAALAGWADAVRIGNGSANLDTIYVLDRVDRPEPSGAAIGTSDAVFLHSIDPADGSQIDEIEVPGNDVRETSVAVDGEQVFVSTDQSFAGSNPDLPEDANGYLTRVSDDGLNLSIVWRDQASTDAAASDAPLRNEPLYTAIGDGTTLVGRSSDPNGGLFGVSPANGAKLWDIDVFSCLGQQAMADADGNLYFNDFCKDVIGSVASNGRVRWLLSTLDPVPTTSGGTVTLPDDNEFRIQSVGADGTVFVTVKPDSVSDNVSIIAIAPGELVGRRSGTSRIETAVEISRTTFPVDDTTRTVVIARADAYPDALSGAPLAFDVGSPLLLTFPTELAAASAAEITRLGATRAILLGGESALGPQIIAALGSIGIPPENIERIAGTNRFDTAAKVAQRLGSPRTVVVEGANPNPLRGWPDAVAASGFAARTGRAILLATQTSLPPETRDVLADLDATSALVVGGPAAITNDVLAQIDAVSPALTVERISGPSRYATSVAVAERGLTDGVGLEVLWIATGTGFADALTAGPAAALTSGTLVLVDGRTVGGSQETYDFLAANRDRIGTVYLVGGESAISTEVANRINTTLGR